MRCMRKHKKQSYFNTDAEEGIQNLSLVYGLLHHYVTSSSGAQISLGGKKKRF